MATIDPPQFILDREAEVRRDAEKFRKLVIIKLQYYTGLHNSSNKTLPKGPHGPSLHAAMAKDRHKLRRQKPQDGVDMGVTKEEWELAAVTIVYALLNPVRLDIDAERLAHGKKNIVRPTERALVEDPCVLLDVGNRIMVWALPGILAPWRQSSYYKAHQQFSKSVEPGEGDGWRHNEANLRTPAQERCKSGAMDFSVGWQQAVHDGPGFGVYFSKSLLLHADPALVWLSAIRHGERLINAVTAFIHPALLDRMLEGMRATSVLPGWDKHQWIHEHWPTVFGGISTVTNRISPSHTDDKAPQHGYDVLSTHGKYGRGKLSFPDLKVTVRYNPGGVWAFSGCLLKHECLDWNRKDADRICYARWMRDPVHELLRVPRCSWSLYGPFQTFFDTSYPENST